MAEVEILDVLKADLNPEFFWGGSRDHL